MQYFNEEIEAKIYEEKIPNHEKSDYENYFNEFSSFLLYFLTRYTYIYTHIHCAYDVCASLKSCR